MRDALAEAREYAESAFNHAKAALSEPDPVDLLTGGAGGLAGSRRNPLGGLGGQGNPVEQLKHYMGWNAAAIRPIAQCVAGQPVRLAHILKRPSGLALRDFARRHKQLYKSVLPGHLKDFSEQLELIEDHPFLDAVNEPNELMTTWSLMFVTVVSIYLTGRCYWWFPQIGGKRHIWYLPTPWVWPVHAEDKLYAQWEIKPLGATHGGVVPGEEIIQFYIPSAEDPLGAVSPTQTQFRAINADEALQEAQQRAFKNGLFPGLILTAGKQNALPGDTRRPTLTTDQRNQIINSIKAMYRGVFRYDEPFILDSIIEKIDKISHLPKEMDFLNSGKQTKARVSQGHGVNPWIMGDTESSNRASAAVASEHFVQFVVNPLLEMLSQVMTQKALPLYGAKDKSLAAYVEPARANDPQMQLMERDQMIRAGALTRNELRAMYNMPPLPGDAGNTVILMPGMALIQQDVGYYNPSDQSAGGGTGKDSDDLMRRLEGIDPVPARRLEYREEE